MSSLLSLMMHIKLLIDISSLFAPTEAQKFVHSFQFQAIVGDECLDNVSFSILKDRANQFYLEIRKYYPGPLEPGYAGIRPKLFGSDESPTDFVVRGEETHGISNLVNQFGIESPVLTFSMAITEHIAAKLVK
ncbi:hypothetical protein BC332_06679 [Capsicum chinense]|nr:hypothetical protein BC332_06679 [Capsicum chinense]